MEDRAPGIWVVAIFFITLTWFAIALRVYVRGYMLKRFGLDDQIILATQIFFTVYCACQIGGLMHGTGKHVWDIKDNDRKIALRFWYLCENFYVVSSSLLKISVGLFLLRVSVERIHIWIIRLVMMGTALFGTMYLFVIMLQCLPISDFWEKSPGEPGSCYRASVVVGCSYAATVLVTITDWTFGILPAFIVWNLKIGRRSKMIVGGILAFAAIGNSASLVRIPYVHTLGHTDDFLYETWNIALWSTVEMGIGITASSVATLRPLLQLLLHKAGLVSLDESRSRTRTVISHSVGPVSKSIQDNGEIQVRNWGNLNKAIGSPKAPVPEPSTDTKCSRRDEGWKVTGSDMSKEALVDCEANKEQESQACSQQQPVGHRCCDEMSQHSSEGIRTDRSRSYTQGIPVEDIRLDLM